MTVRAMKAEAVEFLIKPYGDEALLSAIQRRSSAATLRYAVRRSFDQLATPPPHSAIANGKSWRWWLAAY
jgi:FixJ family two-component response regulator